jgi:hypothetical protein
MPETARGAALRQIQQDRFDSWFRDRRWRVRTELNGLQDREGIPVQYDHGEFWVDPAGEFKTPFGHKGRHGFSICEVDPQTGADLEPRVSAAFGHKVLALAAGHYEAIRDLPDKARSTPPEL